MVRIYSVGAHKTACTVILQGSGVYNRSMLTKNKLETRSQEIWDSPGKSQRPLRQRPSTEQDGFEVWPDASARFNQGQKGST